MAKQKISNERIVSSDLFVKQVETAKKFLIVLEDINKEVEDSARVFGEMVKGLKATGKTAEDINLVEEAFTNLKKVEKELIEIAEKEKKIKESLLDAEKQLSKQRIKEVKLAKQIKDTTEGRVDEEIKLRLELQKSKKERKDQLLVEGEFLDAYQKASKRLIKVRKDQKNLSTQQKLGVKLTKAQEKSLKDLNDELQDLDKTLKEVDAEAGQFQRNVGNYPETTGKAKAAFSSLSGFLLGTLVGAFTKSRETSREFQILLEQVGSVARTVVTGLVTLFKNKLIPTSNNFFLTIKKNKLEVQLFFKELVPEVLRSGKDKKAIEDLNKAVNGLATDIIENRKKIAATKNPLSEEELKKATDAVEENLKVIRELALAEAKLADNRERLGVEIERVRSNEETFQATADDTTLSFQKQAEALEQALKFRTERLALEQQLADEELRISIARVNINLREKGLAEIRNVEEAKRLDLFKEFDKADKIQQQNLTALAESIKKVEAIEGDVASAKQQRDKQSREIARDKFEQDLDFALDISDRQKAINETLIASDQQTVDEKFKTLVKTEQLLESSFDNQIKLTEKFISESLESQGKGQEEIADILSKINIRTLSELEDEEDIRERLLESGEVDEITQNRIREIIIERKAALQDVADLQEQVTQQAIEESRTRDEAEQALLQQRKDIAVTISKDKTDARIKDFEEEENFNQKAFDDSIDLIKEQQKKEIEAVSLKNAILLESAADSADDMKRIVENEEEEIRQIKKKSLESQLELQKTADEKRQEQIQENAEAVNEILQLLEDKQRERFEQRIDGFDKEIEASKNRESALREIVKTGIVDADKNLAFEQRKQAELQKEKEKEQKRQERRELGFTALKTYTAKVESGDKNALQNTVKDVTLLLAAINSLSGFIEGTEKVSDSMNPTLNTGTDDYVARFDGDERIVNPSQNKRLKGISNENVVRIVEKFRNGELSNGIDTKILQVPYQSNEDLKGKFDELINKVENLPKNMPHGKINYDELAHAMVSTTSIQNKILREHKKIGDIW